MGVQGKKRYINEQQRTIDERRTTWTIIIPRQDSQNPRANNRPKTYLKSTLESRITGLKHT